MLSGVEKLYHVSSVISEKTRSLDPTIRATMYSGLVAGSPKGRGQGGGPRDYVRGE